MPIALATHLKVSRHGIFYFRIAIPTHLRPQFGKRELLYSLHTRDPAKAKRLAYTLTSQTHVLFGKMAYDPKRFNPFDVSTFPTSGDAGGLRPYEIDLQQGIFKSDGEDDHRRMMEALAMFKSMPNPLIPASVTAPVPDPARYIEPQPEHTIKLSTALEAWKATLTNSTTRENYITFINHFIAFRGDVEIHTVKPIDAVQWNAQLLKKVSPRTADNRLQALQSLLKWGFKNEYIHHSTPLATEGKFNLTKKERQKQTKGAEPFSVEELNKIFEPTAYTKYFMSYGKRFSESRYWIPLIALHTGMRKEEVAQLHSTDIRSEGDIDYFSVSLLNRASLKTAAAIRNIPIHETLLHLGFMDFVRTKNGKLFNETGNAVSHAFIRHLEDVGVRAKEAKRQEVLHSLRDTFNNTLSLAGVPDNVLYPLMGHEQGDTNSVHYRKPPTLHRLKVEGIAKLVFVETVGGVTHTLSLKKFLQPVDSKK